VTVVSIELSSTPQDWVTEILDRAAAEHGYDREWAVNYALMQWAGLYDAYPRLAAIKSDKLRAHAMAFIGGEMDKYEFYQLTKGYPAQEVADAIGSNVEVVRMRRRYLRQLAKQSKEEG